MAILETIIIFQLDKDCILKAISKKLKKIQFQQSQSIYFGVKNMDKDRRKATIKKKKNSLEDIQDENVVQDVLKTIDYLFESRLIERISRPIDKKIKEEHIEKYGIKLQVLHSKLKKIRTEVVDIASSETPNVRNKSVFGQATSKPGDWKKLIRNIESKYIEVFVDGSFKFFKKVSGALGLTCTRNMDLINIEEWASSCLYTKSSDICC